MLRIRKDDQVKIIAGGHKGKIGNVVKITTGKVWVEGVNVKERHIRPSRVNPRGGKKDVHLPIDISNVALIVGDKDATSKIAYKVTETSKARVAKKTGKEIK
ncbi:50S ribosomal protein L24 [Alphaproteobacteria bacterium]|nr:50S ribosomal protein L24 [Alphaproteobacteria bacterium]